MWSAQQLSIFSLVFKSITNENEYQIFCGVCLLPGDVFDQISQCDLWCSTVFKRNEHWQQLHCSIERLACIQIYEKADILFMRILCCISFLHHTVFLLVISNHTIQVRILMRIYAHALAHSHSHAGLIIQFFWAYIRNSMQVFFFSMHQFQIK